MSKLNISNYKKMGEYYNNYPKNCVGNAVYDIIGEHPGQLVADFQANENFKKRQLLSIINLYKANVDRQTSGLYPF